MKLNLLKNLAIDWAFGFCTLGVIVIVAVALHTIGNIILFMLFGAALFFIAGLLRAISSNMNPWLQGIVVSMGATIPVFVVGMAAFALTASPMLCGFIVLVALACGAGAQTQKFWKVQHRPAGIAIALFLLTGVFVTGKFVVPRLSASSRDQAMNKPAPSFTLAMLDGTPVSLTSLKGHVVVLDFWGTWCAPCVAEMPTLNKTYKEFRGNKDVFCLAVNSGWNNDNPDKIRAFVKARNFDIPVALDTTNAAKKLDATSLPWLILMDRQGHIRMEKSGYDEADQLQKKLTEQVESLLKAN